MAETKILSPNIVFLEIESGNLLDKNTDGEKHFLAIMQPPKQSVKADLFNGRRNDEISR